ncbi:N-methyl-L-tryptophan oxidase [Streptomyces hoynatensis]|uniref:N-methyl-L-tryptophan oxidase n=1 Tax=Streptomyces hoynatensis TaxID=1141874 RepID=A0A3A9YMR5_9ACTN|nr:N-methyl-L-tryptophan oxidase [Streptomyces hoynatensis]RKN37608.1 N-methyl-L-tryptophan oxidase [Streptomyces hoynatensis]
MTSAASPGAARAYDVIVLGLGAMGSAAADRLAARGSRVLGLERFTPAHAHGSSHGGSRIVRQSYFEGAGYVPLLLRSYELFERLERETGREIMLRCGGLMLGREDSAAVAGSRHSAAVWDLPHELLDAAEIRRRFPAFAPGKDVVGLYEERAGLVRPEETVRAQLQLAAAAGAELRFGEPAAGWRALPGGGVEVRTAEGSYAADHLVICPGAWAPELLADLGLPLRVERQLMFWFQPAGGVGPYLPERHPIYIWEDPTGSQIYGFPAIDGPEGGVKGAFFRSGAECTPDTIDRTVYPEEIEEFATYLGARLPGLPGRLVRAATCMYTTTPDEHFVIAPHPRHPAVTVACGFSGHGFKFAPVVGEILADLALTGETAHPIGMFRPERLTGAA